jgi:hypothetical protein
MATIVAKVNSLGSAILLAIGLAGCGGIVLRPSDPTACPQLQLQTLRQPTAALALALFVVPQKSWHSWGTVDRSGTEQIQSVEFVPSFGWPVPANTRGLAFNMHAHVPDELGIDTATRTHVVYLLEYTLPIARCDMSVSWDTRLSITLPNGVCVTRVDSPTQCTSSDPVWVEFDLFAISDSTGTMSVSGSGRSALESAIQLVFATPNAHNRLGVANDTQNPLRKNRAFGGAFDVAQGVAAHVYVGVSALMQKNPHGWLCLNRCTSVPTDQLRDRAVFLVEGGTDGVIGLAMARRQ